MKIETTTHGNKRIIIGKWAFTLIKLKTWRGFQFEPDNKSAGRIVVGRLLFLYMKKQNGV